MPWSDPGEEIVDQADVERRQAAVEQYLALRGTGNGPTHLDEETLLEVVFGEPDADGVYGAGDE